MCGLAVCVKEGLTLARDLPLENSADSYLCFWLDLLVSLSYFFFLYQSSFSSCYNFSISNDLTQMVNFPTGIPDCDSHSPALLDLFISSDASICTTMTFPPLGISDHVVVSVSTDFPSNWQRDALFHRIAYDYSHADWEDLRDNLRDVPWEGIFKLGASATVSQYCEWLQVGIDVNIRHRKYQAKPHSSLWFSASCAAALVYRNLFFSFVPKNKFCDVK